MASKMKLKYPERKDSFAISEYFVICNTSYQIGTFISRSSLSFFKMPYNKIWMFTAVEAIIFALMFVNSVGMYVESLFLICPVIFIIGLMGGGSYVNVLHSLLQLDELDQT